MNCRITYLLNMLSLDNRLITVDSDFNACVLNINNIDFGAVEKILQPLRRVSQDFLIHALG